MRKITIILALLFVTVAAVSGLTGCKKNQCYECSKNVGQTDEGHWNMCDEENHDRAVSMGYTCTEVQ